MPNTYEQFKAFVAETAAATPDREIDHHGTWNACAVGDFAESKGNRDNAGYVADQIGMANYDVWHALNYNGLVWDEKLNQHMRIKTYSQLNQFLLERV